MAQQDLSGAPLSVPTFGADLVLDLAEAIIEQMRVVEWCSKRPNRLESTFRPGGGRVWMASRDMSFLPTEEPIPTDAIAYCIGDTPLKAIEAFERAMRGAKR
jgi:hypothetical protein